jgi:hypothetical protein
VLSRILMRRRRELRRTHASLISMSALRPLAGPPGSGRQTLLCNVVAVRSCCG